MRLEEEEKRNDLKYYKDRLVKKISNILQTILVILYN